MDTKINSKIELLRGVANDDKDDTISALRFKRGLTKCKTWNEHIQAIEDMDKDLS